MNVSSDSIEFYLGDALSPFLVMRSAFQPDDGDLINIGGKTYEVLGRSLTVDHSASCAGKTIRCNVVVERQQVKR